MVKKELDARSISDNVGKRIAIYYNDTASTVSVKTGQLISFDGHDLLIEDNGRQILIPYAKCVRFEIVGGIQ